MFRPVHLLLPGAILLSGISFWVGAGLPGAPFASRVAPLGAVKTHDASRAFGALPTQVVATAAPAEVSDALRHRFAVALAPTSAPRSAPVAPVAAPPLKEPAARSAADDDVAMVPTPPEKPCDMRASGCLDKIGASFATAHLDFEIRQPGYVDALDGPAASLGAGTGTGTGTGAISEADAPAQRVVEAALAPAIPRAPITPGGKVIVYDASQGTDIDPLLQKNWDLNSVQVIPPLKP